MDAASHARTETFSELNGLVATGWSPDISSDSEGGGDAEPTYRMAGLNTKEDIVRAYPELTYVPEFVYYNKGCCRWCVCAEVGRRHHRTRGSLVRR